MQRHGHVVLGVAGGRTTFQGLAAMRQVLCEQGGSLGHVHILQLEVPVGRSPELDTAFANLVRTHVQPGTDLPEAQIHSFEDAGASGDEIRQRMAARLASLGGLTIALLGIGTNAHVAAIEPAAALPLAPFVSQLTAETMRHVPADMQASGLVVTAGIGDLMRADEVIVAAAGAGKAAAVASLGLGVVDPRLPVTMFLAHRRAQFLFDQPAYAELAKCAPTRV
ncbi:MAG: 6-phosphogluconolactonase [Candidatus Sericytochromatia bacterium]|nr:6-phosphogluconolactonase [Candidatus Sericytochromatia bacterium]